MDSGSKILSSINAWCWRILQGNGTSSSFVQPPTIQSMTILLSAANTVSHTTGAHLLLGYDDITCHVMLHIMPCYITTCHTSHHVTVTSHHVMTSHVTRHNVMLHHDTSHVTSRHRKPRHTSCHATSLHVMWGRWHQRPRRLPCEYLRGN